MSSCSTGATGTSCARCWPTTCGWSSRPTRRALAPPTSVCSSASIHAAPRYDFAPAWLDGREVIAVYEDPQAVKPSYLMWLEWTDGRISFIRDYKYVRYVIDDAELVLAPDTAPPGEATADG